MRMSAVRLRTVAPVEIKAIQWPRKKSGILPDFFEAIFMWLS